MKKEFDFSIEVSKVGSMRTTLKNEYLEKEKRLLDVNAKEFANLNDNVYKLRTEVESLSDSVRECKPITSEEMHKLTVKFGATSLCNFLGQIESKYKGAERRVEKVNNVILIPNTASYILVIIVVALSFSFVYMIRANAEISRSVLIWRAVIYCITMIIFEIGIVVAIQRLLNRGE